MTATCLWLGILRLPGGTRPSPSQRYGFGAPRLPVNPSPPLSGLSVVDGQAILHLTSLLEVIQPPVLCIEQVRGFATHPHFGFLRELWTSLGYRLLWSDVVDLHDFAPSTRPRYLAVIVRADVVPPAGLSNLGIVLPKRPCLGDFGCILDLPEPLLRDCLLNDHLRQIYQDPQYVPKSHVDSVNSSPCLSVLGAIFYIPIFALSGRLSWLRRDIEVRSPAGRCSGHALDFSPAPFLTGFGLGGVPVGVA